MACILSDVSKFRHHARVSSDFMFVGKLGFVVKHYAQDISITSFPAELNEAPFCHPRLNFATFTGTRCSDFGRVSAARVGEYEPCGLSSGSI
jgi:hypothetical protein